MSELDVLIANIKRFLGIPDTQPIPIREDRDEEKPRGHGKSNDRR